MVTIGSTVSIRIPVGDETVTFICRRPSASEHSKFLRDRFEAKGRKMQNHLYEAREALIDKILVDVQGAEFETAEGIGVALNNKTTLNDADVAKWSGLLGVQVTSWKDLIPASWKSSAAMRFEDAQPDDEADEKN